MLLLCLFVSVGVFMFILCVFSVLSFFAIMCAMTEALVLLKFASSLLIVTNSKICSSTLFSKEFH